MITVDTLLNLIPVISVIIALLFNTITLRNTEKTRKKDMILSRITSLTEQDFKTSWDVQLQQWTTPEEWYRKYNPKANIDAYVQMQYTLYRYNGYGLLLRENLIDSDILFEIVPPHQILPLWKKFEPIIKQRRELTNNPSFLKAFEYLYNETIKRYPQITPLDPKI